MSYGRWPRAVGEGCRCAMPKPLRNNVGKADAVSQPFPHCPDSGALCPSTVTITSQVTVNEQWASASESVSKDRNFQC